MVIKCTANFSLAMYTSEGNQMLLVFLRNVAEGWFLFSVWRAGSRVVFPSAGTPRTLSRLPAAVPVRRSPRPAPPCLLGATGSQRWVGTRPNICLSFCPFVRLTPHSGMLCSKTPTALSWGRSSKIPLRSARFWQFLIISLLYPTAAPIFVMASLLSSPYLL